MLLRQIEYFLAIVNNGSFSEAAEECHISQSAVSQQIKALEEELGVPLLLRHNRTFSLTPAGELFFRKATVLMNDLNQLRKDVVKTGRSESERLRIGYLRCYGGSEFQDAAAVFSHLHPETELEIITGNHEDLYDALRREEVDVILNDQRRAFSDDYVNFELIKSRCYIEIASHHPFASLSEIEVGDLKNTPCILVAGKSQQNTESDYYRDIVGFTGEHLFAETLPEARIMAASGQGFLPLEGIREDVYYDSSIARIPLFKKGQPVLRNYCAFWKKENTAPSVREFADILKSQFR
ncbi:MAG: LysR family transcriptional regulator [Solobacterium sp.]|nr:LysR family transcriptional regulator [Solobacterium sp.]